MIRKPLAFAERQVPAGLQAFNLTKLAVSKGRRVRIGSLAGPSLVGRGTRSVSPGHSGETVSSTYSRTRHESHGQLLDTAPLASVVTVTGRRAPSSIKHPRLPPRASPRT